MSPCERLHWQRAPRRTTEPILENRRLKVAQGLHSRSKICVSYTPKGRDVHDLPWRRTNVRVRRCGEVGGADYARCDVVIWQRAPRRTTEPILENRRPKVAQGLHGRSKICVSYKPKRRDVHDLPRRRTFVRVRR